MKRTGYAVVLSALVVGVWFEWGGQTGGQQEKEPLFDSRFCSYANGDGQLDISDAVTILSFLFTGGEPPYCVAQNLSLDNRFVNEGQPGAITAAMIADGSVSPEKIDLAGCGPGLRNVCEELNELKRRIEELEQPLGSDKRVVRNEFC